MWIIGPVPGQAPGWAQAGARGRLPGGFRAGPKIGSPTGSDCPPGPSRAGLGRTSSGYYTRPAGYRANSGRCPGTPWSPKPDPGPDPRKPRTGLRTGGRSETAKLGLGDRTSAGRCKEPRSCSQILRACWTYAVKAASTWLSSKSSLAVKNFTATRGWTICGALAW